MGRHRAWRKIAKKERRRKIRKLLAKQEDEECLSESFLKEQGLIEKLMIEQVQKSNEEENEKWIQAEKIALSQWKLLQEEKQKMLNMRLEKETKLKLEWELEQKKKVIEEEKIKAAQEELKRKHETFMENLDKFLTGNSDEPPSELKVIRETRQNAELCPFFYKTACCRFGDQCSRNHKYPGISKVLLATNFYTHFGLSNANMNEYDTDIMLEYEDSDTYKDFKDFFYDVVSEFEKFGKITQFKVCNNYEKHLRGNTYIEFAELRCAVAAYRALHTRWYGGRQLSLQFCFMNSWKSAVCGLQLQRRCPKGRACNFLHVFRNPSDLFSAFSSVHSHDSDRQMKLLAKTKELIAVEKLLTDTETYKQSHSSVARSWRWSESPEIEIPRRTNSRTSENSENRRRRSSRDDSDYHKRRRRSSRRSDRR